MVLHRCVNDANNWNPLQTQVRDQGTHMIYHTITQDSLAPTRIKATHGHHAFVPNMAIYFGRLAATKYSIHYQGVAIHRPLTKYARGLHPECRESYPHRRGLAIPTCIMACVSCTCCDACRDRKLAVSFEVRGEENVPGIPGACATRNFANPIRGPFENSMTTESYVNSFSITGPLCNKIIR